jgi:hypothetical protein
VQQHTLRVVFITDALLAVGFGLFSWIYPHQTFGTIVSIPEMGSSVFFSVLSILSIFYVLTGLTCLIGFMAKLPVNIWIGLLMIVRHLLEGSMKILDMDKEWLIGNPYPDIIIHSAFISFYILGIYFIDKQR